MPPEPLPNIDIMTRDELKSYANSLQHHTAVRAFPGLSTTDAALVRAIAFTYATDKHNACIRRENGDIALALAIEAELDCLYKLLPTRLQW